MSHGNAYFGANSSCNSCCTPFIPYPLVESCCQPACCESTSQSQNQFACQPTFQPVCQLTYQQVCDPCTGQLTYQPSYQLVYQPICQQSCHQVFDCFQPGCYFPQDNCCYPVLQSCCNPNTSSDLFGSAIFSNFNANSWIDQCGCCRQIFCLSCIPNNNNCFDKNFNCCNQNFFNNGFCHKISGCPSNSTQRTLSRNVRGKIISMSSTSAQVNCNGLRAASICPVNNKLVALWGITFDPVEDQLVITSNPNVQSTPSINSGNLITYSKKCKSTVIPITQIIPSTSPSTTIYNPTAIVYNNTHGFRITAGATPTPTSTSYFTYPYADNIIYLFAATLINGDSSYYKGISNIFGYGQSTSFYNLTRFTSPPTSDRKTLYYTGLALTKNYLAAADLSSTYVDFFSINLPANSNNNTLNQLVYLYSINIATLDTAITTGYGVFNVYATSQYLFVSLAKYNPTTGAPISGSGIIEVFDVANPSNTYLGQFTSNLTVPSLSSPYGMISRPVKGCPNLNYLFVGNYGSGFISVFVYSSGSSNSVQGKFLGNLSQSVAYGNCCQTVNVCINNLLSFTYIPCDPKNLFAWVSQPSDDTMAASIGGAVGGFEVNPCGK
jgi:hypothetical protein